MSVPPLLKFFAAPAGELNRRGLVGVSSDPAAAARSRPSASPTAHAFALESVSMFERKSF